MGCQRYSQAHHRARRKIFGHESEPVAIAVVLSVAQYQTLTVPYHQVPNIHIAYFILPPLPPPAMKQLHSCSEVLATLVKSIVRGHRICLSPDYAVTQMQACSPQGAGSGGGNSAKDVEWVCGMFECCLVCRSSGPPPPRSRHGRYCWVTATAIERISETCSYHCSAKAAFCQAYHGAGSHADRLARAQQVQCQCSFLTGPLMG